MTAGTRRANATFWLLAAPDSIVKQSHREPDGTGLGYYDSAGAPQVDKQPIAAYEDAAFAREAREIQATTFIAHVRFASTGGLKRENTHPFEQCGRIFAHNGVLQDLPALERELGDYRDLVRGDSDSERFFALITKETHAHGGDVGAGIATAAQWVARELPVFAINLVLITEHNLWALRYPSTHDLLVCERPAGGGASLDQVTSTGARLRTEARNRADAVIVASEALDEAPGWRSLASGELLHVDRELRLHSQVVVDRPPAKPLTLADLDPRAAASQGSPTPSSRAQS